MTQTVLITGASSGFGAAAARRFAAAGWNVVATGRRAERLQPLVDAFPGRVHAALFDVRDSAAMEQALAALPDGFRDIDLLVNNAGLALGTAPAQDCSLDDWRTMIDTNVTALVTMTRTLLPTLIARKGAIVNISSTASKYPYPGGNVYGATKAFVKQFSLNLRADLAGTAIRVTNLEPGLCGGTEFSNVRFHGDDAKAATVYQGVQAIQPEDIANTVLWVSQQPAHVNINSIEIMPVAQTFGPLQISRR